MESIFRDISLMGMVWIQLINIPIRVSLMSLAYRLRKWN